jgi:hypothetical protein
MIIPAENKAGNRARTTSECSCKSRDVGVRPLYRDDIFFGASLQKLPQYTSQVRQQASRVLCGRARGRNVQKFSADGFEKKILHSSSSSSSSSRCVPYERPVAPPKRVLLRV